MVIKDGKVIYDRANGWLNYNNQEPVTENTLYDLASITKVAATLQTVMFMHEKGLIDINKKASVYLPELKKSNKKDYTLKDILTHQAGLWPFLPFWATTVKDSKPLPEYYSSTSNSNYPFPVTEENVCSYCYERQFVAMDNKIACAGKNTGVPFMGIAIAIWAFIFCNTWPKNF
jgi:beta-N-acetylhexosaminidase